MSKMQEWLDAIPEYERLEKLGEEAAMEWLYSLSIKQCGELEELVVHHQFFKVTNRIQQDHVKRQGKE